MSAYALGVDIGGTKVSVTLGDARGKILAKELLPTRTGKKAKQGIKELAETLNRFKSNPILPAPAKLGRSHRIWPPGAKSGRSRRIVGIGIGVPGPVDPKAGVVERSPHLKGWEGFPLKSFIERKVGLPVFITNDANAAAVGEKSFGGGRGVDDFVYLTISTGIGGGIILGGKLLIGASCGAGEVGHTIVVPGGERCGCGQRGCLEAYASGTAIANFVRREISHGRSSKVKKLVRSVNRRVTAEGVALAAEKGDRLALEAFRRAGFYLGIGLANLINLLNPQRLILGGSVMKSSRFLWGPMMRSVRRHAWPSLYRACRITKTRLGDRVGDLGALALVFAGTRSSDI